MGWRLQGLMLAFFFLILLQLFKLQGFVLEALEVLVFRLFFPEVLNKYVSITEDTPVCRKSEHWRARGRPVLTQVWTFFPSQISLGAGGCWRWWPTAL